MDNELEVIRDQMELKRESLTEKLDALEDRVLDTVHDATSQVSNTVRDVTVAVDTVKDQIHETVETVKDQIHETVETVKETLNVSDKVRQHPWVAIGGSFAVGFFGGLLLTSSSRKQRPTEPIIHRPETNGAPPRPVRLSANEAQVSDTSSGLLSQLETAGSETLNTIKGIAVGTLLGVLSEVVSEAVPTTLKSEVNKIFTDLNSHLGGKALYKLDQPNNQSTSTDTWKGEGNDYRDEAEVGRKMGTAQGQGEEPLGQSDRRRVDPGSRGLRKNHRTAQGANGKEP